MEQSADTVMAATVTTDETAERKKKKRSIVILVTIGCLIAVVILIVVLCVALIDNNPSPEPERQWSPGFSTGVSLITSYAINTEVRSRLATTELTMEVANALNCSSVHVVTLQLPLNTRVTSLQTTADDGCTSTGEVQEIEDAKDTFEEQVAQGLPGAFVEVDDAFTYSLQVSIPPLGVTKVKLVVEQILQQQLGEVFFDIPMIPNEKVDMVVLDLSVEDLSGNAVEYVFDLDVVTIGLDIDTETDSNGNNTMITSTGDKNNLSASSAIHLDIPDARQYDLPRVVQGRYTPEVLPESGLLYADDQCFEHFFVPDSLEGMPRNIHFLLDTSQSMQYDDKLIKAKEAMTSLIETLTPRDTFTIQTFGELGTEELWGSGPGTPDEKEEAKDFLSSLNATRYYGTNLNEALLEGMLRAKSTAEKSTEDSAVTILFVISDSYASEGEESRSKIVKHVYELNREGIIKIFAMGFQEDADLQLLDAIALLTGGVSAPILRGSTTDVAAQIVDFFSSWLGDILLSDVNVNVDLAAESARVFGETQQSFSMLSSGYEVVVRGLLEVPDDLATDLQLRAITSAGTLMGASEWETIIPIQQGGSNKNNGNDRSSKASLCFQSYAHARVTQLMRLYEASKFIDHDLILELVSLAHPEGCDEEQQVDCIKVEALALALDAKLVAKGLTAMVTVENETCQKIVEGAEICLDGTTPNEDGRGSDYSGSSDSYYSSAREKSHGAVSILFALLVLVATLFQW